MKYLVVTLPLTDSDLMLVHLLPLTVTQIFLHQPICSARTLNVVFLSYSLFLCFGLFHQVLSPHGWERELRVQAHHRGNCGVWLVTD